MRVVEFPQEDRGEHQRGADRRTEWKSISGKGNGVKNIYSGLETIWFLNIILLSILKREIFFLSLRH